MKTLQLNIFILNIIIRAFLVAQSMKNLPAMQETWVWEIPWTEEPWGLQSIGSQRVRHIQATKPPLSHHDKNNMSMNSIPKQCIFWKQYTQRRKILLVSCCIPKYNCHLDQEPKKQNYGKKILEFQLSKSLTPTIILKHLKQTNTPDDPFYFLMSQHCP